MLRNKSIIKHLKIAASRKLTDYAKIQLFWSSVIRNKKVQLRHINTEEIKYLNLGCGKKIHKNFINLDFKWRPGIDLCWDIRRNIPLPDNSMLGIYTEHCLEHVSFNECQRAISDFHRILKINGVLRIVLPDGGLYLDLYNKSRTEKNVVFPYPVFDKEMLPMMYINRVFYEPDHKFLYDYETLSLLLERAGFINIRKTAFREGKDKNLLIDNEHYKVESLYVEADA